MIYKFPARFHVAYRISGCDCCDTVDIYEIRAEVFCENERRAKELLLSWLPNLFRLKPNEICFLKKRTRETREGVLFLSREHVYRGDFDKAPE